MTLPEKFRRTTEPSIASYDATDIALGIGFVNFYGGRTDASNYIMTSRVFYSSATETANSTTSGTPVLVTDIDFDIEFKQPQIIKGKTVINIPIRVNHNGGGVSADGRVDITIVKYDGSTETTIVSEITGQTRNSQGANSAEEYTEAFSVDIPNTHFKSGETLRLTVKAYANINGGGTAETSIGHDPQNRSLYGGGNDWNSHPTIMIFQVPFRIDL